MDAVSAVITETWRDLVHGELDAEHAVLEAVVEEDVREARGDEGLDAEVRDAPGRVLARGPAAEVVPADHDRGGAVPAPPWACPQTS